jgi:hypothetical protein
MPELPLEFEVYCQCGAGMCRNCSEGRRTNGRGVPYITIEPCERCLEAARDEGRREAEEEYEQTQI